MNKNTMIKPCDPEELRQIRILSGLDAAALRKIVRCVEVESYDKGQSILLERQLDSMVLFILTGKIRLSRKMSVHRQIVIEELAQGDYFANSGDIPFLDDSISIEASAHCKIGFMPEVVFRSFLLQNPEMTLQHLQKLTRLLRGLNTRMKDAMFLDARSRIQKTLMEFVVKTSRGAHIPDLPTHAEIASRADTQREVVSREMSRLLRKKILVKSGARYKIAKPEMLEADQTSAAMMSS